ncbi:hypothetical protein MFRU_047g00130 [Monilinia fructicola]|nr:hypothetical protein MFRU_047g00130 [Monilinia fructicola]
MSTAPDPKFPDLPGLIFGCAPSKHRRSPVKMLLGRYNVKVKGNDKKEDYLLKLVELENSIGEREKEALVNWFAGENTCKALAALLGDALQPPIIPKDIVEPAAKKAKLQSDDDLIFAAVDECRICTERLAPENFPQSRITSTCGHHPTVCKSCLTRYINTEVQTKASDQISCPQCPEMVSEIEIKAYASPEILARNKRRASMMSRQHLPNFTFCLSLACESGQIHAEPDQPMMTCTTCGFKTCFKHKLPWHADLTCAEFDNLNQGRVQQEAASEAWLAENTKLCPNPECGMRIQTKSGCDHLTCDYCLFEFCWACCVDFSVIKKRGNGAHKPECEWHTDNKDGMPGHGRRRAAVSRQSAVPKASKQSRDLKKSNGERCEVGRASKDMNVREELKGPEQVTGLEDLNDPEGVKKSHKSKETVESVESLEAIGLTQPGIPTESEKSFQPNKSHEAVKSLETTGAMESTRSNPLKRRLEE